MVSGKFQVRQPKGQLILFVVIRQRPTEWGPSQALRLTVGLGTAQDLILFDASYMYVYVFIALLAWSCPH